MITDREAAVVTVKGPECPFCDHPIKDNTCDFCAAEFEQTKTQASQDEWKVKEYPAEAWYNLNEVIDTLLGRLKNGARVVVSDKQCAPAKPAAPAAKPAAQASPAK